jgi:glycerol uptake facilitator-like aquaporin
MTARVVVGEALGTAFLLVAIVGSGIMGEQLAGGNVGIALLANSLATGVMLIVLILTFGPVSGAHFNPVVSLAAASQGELSWRMAGVYVLTQTCAAVAGAGLADVMFGQPVFALSQKVRSGSPLLLSEFVATFGLMAVIWACSRQRPLAVPLAVGAYITGAYWFTSSTSFANPAVTIARSVTDTFTGIRPIDAPAFIAAQMLGAAASTVLFRWLIPPRESHVRSVIATECMEQ